MVYFAQHSNSESPMSLAGQSLHFGGRPVTSDFTSTADLWLHRANRRDVPEPEVGVASENHRQTVRQEWPILIHTASAALLSLGTVHPSIIKTSGPAGVSGVGSRTGSRS